MPVITKRKTTPASLPYSNQNAHLPQLIIKTDHTSSNTSEKITEIGVQNNYNNCAEFDIPIIYNPFTLLFHFLVIAIPLIIAGILLAILVNILLFSLMGIIVFFSKKRTHCKNCGQTFDTKKAIDNSCPYCGALIEDEIKAH